MSIEVILNEPIEGLGAEADIVKVKSGFARNHLFPTQKAAMATAASKRQIEELRKKRAEREARELNEAQELAGKLAKVTLTFQMQTAEGTRVFGSVTAQDIVTRLEEMKITLDKRKLGLHQPIKTIGETVINASLGHDVHASFKVILEAPIEEKAAAPERKKRFPRAEEAETSDSEE